MKEVVMDDDDEVNRFVPKSVGELIEFLQNYPRDYALDIYYGIKDCYGSDWETTSTKMTARALNHSRCLEITIK